MYYVSVSLTPEARDALRALTLELVGPLRRRVSMSEVLLASLAVAQEHQPELLTALSEEA
jgi:hypothetical protein